MKQLIKNPVHRWIILAVVVVVALLIVWRLWSASANALPKGIASGNGRIESQLVDVAAKEPLRVREVLVQEGDLVKPGQVLVRLNTETLDAELAAAKANVTAVQEKLAMAQATIQRSKSEIELARIEARRSRALVDEGAGSQRELDVRRTRVQTTTASLAEAEAKLQAAIKEVAVAQANVDKVQSRINDATLVSPVIGRVLYRLAEPGEVVGPGGKTLTLVDLSDVYMEIYLPSNQAAALKLGDEGRITLDYLPDWTVPASVRFVSPEAQFTPKPVETRSEREMLVFRVKLQIPSELVLHYVKQIKTGVRGVGYVRIDPSAKWPKRLQRLLSVESDSSSNQQNPD
jgi:HlyD family secretion protein